MASRDSTNDDTSNNVMQMSTESDLPNTDESNNAAGTQNSDEMAQVNAMVENASANLNAVETGECAEPSTNAESTAITTDSKTSDPGGAEKSNTEIPTENCDSTSEETVTFKVIYNKQKYDVTFPLDSTILKLKDHINTLTGVPSAMQKIMYKGLAKDDCSLRTLKVTKGSKIMVVGSTMNDVLAVTNTPSQKEIQDEAKASATKEPLSQQKQHKKVLDKYGKPEDALPGIKNSKQPIPPQPLTGMYNKSGGKVRLTFKLELDQLWLGTKERTEKLPMNSIKAVVSEPLVGHEEYHMLALQLGPTEASRYWIYWVPAQYVDAIKDTVLGKWQFF